MSALGLLLSMTLAQAGAPTTEPVSVEDQLRRAHNEYAYGNYDEAVKRLSALLYPMQLYSDEQVIEARRLMALSHYLLGTREEAEHEFKLLLLRSPDFELDPFTIAPGIIDVFERLRKELKPQLDGIRQRKLDDETRDPANGRTLQTTITQHSDLATLMPFGLGQFQNQDWAWGSVFAATEMALLAINVSAYMWGRSLKNELRKDGRRGYRTEDAGLVRNLMLSQYASAALLGVVWSTGVLHARLNFVPITVRTRTLEPSSAPKGRPLSGYSPEPATKIDSSWGGALMFTARF